MQTSRNVSVVMPVYNEFRTIDEIVRRVLSMPCVLELIIVDDGSIDGTRARIRAIAEHNAQRIVALFHEQNKGKGMAIRTALPHAHGDIVIIQDADLEYNPADYEKLIAPIIAGEALVVYGSRNSGTNRTGSKLYKYGVLFFSWIANRLYGTHITDIATCYKAFKREVLQNVTLMCTGFEFCPEVTARIAKKGYYIHEVPISYAPRTRSEGKKIKMRDGALWIWVLFRELFRT